MVETLELPNGETVTPDDVFLFENYPYRFLPDDAGNGVDSGRFAFVLRPLYWGGGDMDVPFSDREALVEQWSEASEGTMTEAEWRAWLREARDDDRFDDAEIDALSSELLPGGPLARLRRVLGR